MVAYLRLYLENRNDDFAHLCLASRIRFLFQNSRDESVIVS